MAHISFLDQQAIKTIKESKELKQNYIAKFTETECSQLKELVSSVPGMQGRNGRIKEKYHLGG